VAVETIPLLICGNETPIVPLLIRGGLDCSPFDLVKLVGWTLLISRFSLNELISCISMDEHVADIHFILLWVKGLVI